MTKKFPYQTLESKIVYSNPWWKVRQDKIIHPDGKEGVYNVVERNDAVAIIPLTSDQEIYLIYLYRYPTQMYSWELPCGGIDKQAPLKAAKRELEEETGLRAKKWTRLGEFQTSNGTSSERCSVFLAQDLEETNKNEKEEEGIEEVKKVKLTQAYEMIKNGQITDSFTISSLMILQLNMGEVI